MKTPIREETALEAYEFLGGDRADLVPLDTNPGTYQLASEVIARTVDIYNKLGATVCYMSPFTDRMLSEGILVIEVIKCAAEHEEEWAKTAAEERVDERINAEKVRADAMHERNASLMRQYKELQKERDGLDRLLNKIRHELRRTKSKNRELQVQYDTMKVERNGLRAGIDNAKENWERVRNETYALCDEIAGLRSDLAVARGTQKIGGEKIHD